MDSLTKPDLPYSIIRRMKTISRLIAVPLSLMLAVGPVWGATAAFCGKVTAVKPATAKQKDTLTHFTVKIDFYDYISRGKFGGVSRLEHVVPVPRRDRRNAQRRAEEQHDARRSCPI